MTRRSLTWQLSHWRGFYFGVYPHVCRKASCPTKWSITRGLAAFVTQVSQLKQMADFGMGSFTVNSLKEALNVSGMMPMFNANALGQVFTDNSKHLFYTIEAEGGQR